MLIITNISQDVNSGTVDAGVIVDMTKCATGSPETVSSGRILPVLSTNRMIWFGLNKKVGGIVVQLTDMCHPVGLSPGWPHTV